MKDPATEDKVRLKYPYVASELLSLELEVIYGTILRSEDLSKLLFDFLRCVSSLQRVPSRLLTQRRQVGQRVRLPALRLFLQGKTPNKRAPNPHPPPLTHPQVVSQLLVKSPVSCIQRIKQLDVVDGLIANINNFAMCTLPPPPPVIFCNILRRVELLLRLASLSEDPNVSVPPEELQWLAETNFVHRLVELLHSPDADRQSHANVALTGLIRTSQLRSPSVTPLPLPNRYNTHNP